MRPSQANPDADTRIVVLRQPPVRGSGIEYTMRPAAPVSARAVTYLRPSRRTSAEMLARDTGLPATSRAFTETSTLSFLIRYVIPPILSRAGVTFRFAAARASRTRSRP